MPRRFGDPVDPRRAYADRPGAYSLIPDGGDLLLTDEAAPEREFQLPGGGIDPGEGTLAALHRECLEEAGWRIRVERRLGAFQRYTYMPEYRIWARKVCHIYLACPVLRLGPPRDPGHRAVWMEIGAAAELLGNAGDRSMAAGLLRRGSVLAQGPVQGFQKVRPVGA